MRKRYELFYRTTWTSDFPRISCQSYLLGTTLGQQGVEPQVRRFCGFKL
jgi:hypothetical protein